MSRVLCKAVIQALKEAHQAYLSRQPDRYRKSMKEAECGIQAIRSLGMEDGCGREMELMCLQAEATLMHALSHIHRPGELIPKYEMSLLQMLIPPSRVIPREAPMLAKCEDALDFFGGPSERVAEELERAAALYAKLTDGGGGGVSEIYRAQMERQRGQPEAAAYWAKLALERMCGDKWIEPIARTML